MSYYGSYYRSLGYGHGGFRGLGSGYGCGSYSSGSGFGGYRYGSGFGGYGDGSRFGNYGCGYHHPSCYGRYGYSSFY